METEPDPEEMSEECRALDAEARRIAETMGYDSVQIITTRYIDEGKNTLKHTGAFGNWFTRYGSVIDQKKTMDEEIKDS